MKKVKNSAAFFINSILLMVLIGCSPNKASPSPDEIQIRNIRHLSNEAIAMHDSLTIGNYWTEDFQVLSSRNINIVSREANRQVFIREFNTRKNVVYARTPGQIDIFLDWNMAAETGIWTGQWQEPDGTVKISGTYYAKWHKMNGGWKIRAEIFTPLSCSGSVYCNQLPKLY
ncbi:MAG: nuclear transport factor 2 family protein [Saprospiraceae bacterium]|jgi:ketosteroid isomerase-like protein|nr:DUF4440 domain-containing protein [Bacteroidota bacterium]MCE2769272.1 nuclear transport factor 2 family protein [Saprospiraceae bacterium]